MVSEELKKVIPIALGATAAGIVIASLAKGKEEYKGIGFEIDVKIE